jgi:hypothetical protein
MIFFSCSRLLTNFWGSPQYVIGFHSKVLSGRPAAGFFNRGRVFPAWQGFSTDYIQPYDQYSRSGETFERILSLLDISTEQMGLIID